MKIKTAQFEISNSDFRKCPKSDKPEYAFIGRSNVGKSSLINMLTQRKTLAKTSSTPGKTLLINHFLINGYAKRGKEEREKLQQIIRGYIMGRQQMTNLFVLVDSRLEPQKVDMEFMQWLGETGIPFSIVFTKIDKLGNQAKAQNIKAYKDELLKTWEELPPIFITSSETGEGRDEVLAYIQSINESLKQ